MAKSLSPIHKDILAYNQTMTAADKAICDVLAAEIRYTSAAQINKKELKRWLKKAGDIQWDYKNIVKRKGILERLH